jgi:hypothetical protein
MTVIQFISAFGLGALVTAFVQAWLSQRADNAKRNFQEKKECYVGLLEAYGKACLKSDTLAKNDFAYWSVRCSLVAPENIRELINEMKTSDYEKQGQAFERLQSDMRKDLGVQPK